MRGSVVFVLLAACTARGNDHLGWNTMPSLPTPRAGHATCYVGQDLTVVGGTDDTGSSDVLVLKDLHDQWIARASLIRGRTDPVCAGVDGKLFVFGGGPPHGEVLEPNTGAFHELASTTPFGAGAVMLVQPTTFGAPPKVFAFGGGSNQASVYDVTSDTWTSLTPEPIGRQSAGAALRVNDATQHQEIWIFGGHNDTDPDGIRAIDVYDIETDRWRAGGETAAPLAQAAVIEGEELLLVGRVTTQSGGFFVRTDAATITNDVVTGWSFRPALAPARTLSVAGAVLTGGETPTGEASDLVAFFESAVPR